MNLHNEVMNIPVPKSVIHNLEHPDCKDMFSAHSYKIGHRDARHAAAELSLKAEARIEELEDMLSRLVKENDLAMPNENYQWLYSPMRVECLKLLEDK